MFTEALPVFLKGKETEINCTAVFRAVFEAKSGQSFSFRGTASSLYSDMAKLTGTLWENNVNFLHASCNHGFASHVCRWLLNA